MPMTATSTPGFRASTVEHDAGAPASRRLAWAAAALVLFATGILGAVFAADSAARSNADDSTKAFQASSAEIASTLQLAIVHEQDLTIDASAFLGSHPNATNTEFGQWVLAVQAFQRYPELQGIGESGIILRSELPAFVRRTLADPPGPLGPNGTFMVLPPGDRPFYCMALVGSARDNIGGSAAGVDYCARDHGALVMGTRDRGTSTFGVLPQNSGWLGVSTPVYRGGVVPADVAGRRDAFVGDLGEAVVTSVILDRALQGHPNTAITLRVRDGISDVRFVRGAVSGQAQTTTLDLRPGWTVQTSAPAPATGLWADRTARALLLLGIALSALLSALIFVLGTGRTRALQLVHERTAQLREQIRERGRLVTELIRVRETERTRVANELHDGPLQRLSAVNLRLTRIPLVFKKGDSDGALVLLDDAMTELRTEIGSIRSTMVDLRPPALDAVGLAAAIRDHAMRVTTSTGLSLVWSVDDGLDVRPARDTETILYRVAQDALANVLQHANATSMTVTLARSDGRVILEVHDDGVGFAISHVGDAAEDRPFGIATMRERVVSAGGQFTVQSTPGRGTTVRASIPDGHIGGDVAASKTVTVGA